MEIWTVRWQNGGSASFTNPTSAWLLMRALWDTGRPAWIE